MVPVFFEAGVFFAIFQTVSSSHALLRVAQNGLELWVKRITGHDGCSDIRLRILGVDIRVAEHAAKQQRWTTFAGIIELQVLPPWKTRFQSLHEGVSTAIRSAPCSRVKRWAILLERKERKDNERESGELIGQSGVQKVC